MNVKYIVQRFGEDIYCKCSPFTIISSVVSVDDLASGEEIPDILNRIEEADTWCMYSLHYN